MSKAQLPPYHAALEATNESFRKGMVAKGLMTFIEPEWEKPKEDKEE